MGSGLKCPPGILYKRERYLPSKFFTKKVICLNFEYSEKQLVKHLIYLFKTFIVIGSTSFGGYMALIAIMRNRMVIRDKTIDDNLITEGISLASMLPGPVAVNVVAYTGFHIAGITGALVSVISVLIPSFILVLILTLVYFQADGKIQFDSILLGIFPVITGVILSTGISMGKKVCTKLSHYLIAVVSFIILFFFKGYWPILLTLGLSALPGILFFSNEVKPAPVPATRPWKPVLLFLGVYVVFFTVVILFSSGSVLGKLFEQFSYISLTLFGGGYVMIPVLKSILVEQQNWINNQEFIYGISIGQITPGPILISSVFFGYKMAGVAGSLIASIGIFFPSAMLMIIFSNIFISLKHNKIIQSALLGLKPAVAGMILYSGFSIFMEHMTSGNLFLSLALVAAAFWLVFRLNIATAIVIVAGAILGFIIY